ncbi:MAG: type II toxin-antitoxin system Phd/YefM family antitoxin [Burkholderiales bacterium]
MAQFNIAKAKMHLSELVQKALLGEEVVIAKDNKALVKLVSLVPPRRMRKPGSAKGRIWMAPDFDATPDDFKDYT